MKKLFVNVCILTIVIIGCSPIKLDISLQQPEESRMLAYSDEFIDVNFQIKTKCIAFDMRNKTQTGIKINWDELSYISPAGKSLRIIHSGIRLIDRNVPQAVTVIPPNSSFSDIVIPSKHIYYSSFSTEWCQTNLFQGDKTLYVGKNFAIYMPLEIKGKRKEYTFRFVINKVIRE